MIYYLVTAEHAYTIEWLLDTWRPALYQRVQVLPYEDLFEMDRFPGGTYIFTDLDRLDAARFEVAAQLCDRLLAERNQVLNHPRRVLDRHDLLATLHARGESGFRLYRLTETREPGRFPVFLRLTHAHEVCSDLLSTQEELDAAVAEMITDGYTLDDLLMAEYLDTSDEEGVFRMYGMSIIKDRLIPAWVYVGKNWELRFEEKNAAREWIETQQFMAIHDYDDWTRSVCSLANIQYGRVDFSVKNGKPQLWEINTNPTLLFLRELTSDVLMPYSEYFADVFVSAMEAIDTSPGE